MCKSLSAFLILLISGNIAYGAELSRRDAALRVMGFSIFVPGAAAYCMKKYSFPQTEFEAVVQWNKDHENTMKQAIAAIEETGGMSKDMRVTLDKLAYRLVASEIDSGDPRENCQSLSMALKNRVLDMSSNPDLKDALRILMAK